MCWTPRAPELTPPPTAVQRLPPPPVTGLVTRLLVCALALLCARPAVSFAHEIPSNVVVRAFVKAEGQRLRLLVRVPLDAMRDVEFPLRGAAGAATRAPYLDLARADETLRDAAKLWIADGLALYEDDTRLGDPTIVVARAALPSDRAFGRYDDALALLMGAALPATTELPWQQAMLDVLLEYRISSATARFAIEPALAHLGVKTTTVLHVVRSDGTDRVLTFDGDPGRVSLDPTWWNAAWHFMRMGFTHILDGIDHLLFLLCLVIPFRKVRPVLVLVTAFTIAHSLTLVASAAGYAPDALWFPPLVEVLIALSIVYMACENIVGAKIERRWPMAFAFGLVHGFGFSFALRDSLQFAGAHLAVSLASFNVGVELGQLAALAVAIPVLSFAFSKIVAERVGTILLSAMVGHEAWHWMTERFGQLRQYRFTWPTLDALFLADAMRGTAIALVLGAVGWLVAGRVRRWLAPAQARTASIVLAAALLGTIAPRPAVAQRALRSTMAGVYTVEQAAGGKDVFVGSCTGCHTSASHTGPAFALKWMGRPLAELYDFVSQRMPKATPGSLSEDEYVMVTAYVLKLNGMPAGKTELSADPAVLGTIRFDTTLSEPSKPTRELLRELSSQLSWTSTPLLSPMRANPHVRSQDHVNTRSTSRTNTRNGVEQR